jgi:renalase
MDALNDVIVVGAGLAGLAAARDLQDAGLNVLTLEKSRGVGGRCATKRLELGGVRFRADHGAQFFTARGARLKALVTQLEASGVVKQWTRGFPKLTTEGLEARADGHGRFVCPNGMSDLAKALVEADDARSLEVRQNSLVSAVFPSGNGWSAVLENGDIHQARVFILNAPAPQSLALTRSSLLPQTLQALDRVRFDPCWAVVMVLGQTPEIDWVGLEIQDSVLEWAALDSSKRTPNGPATLVLHATPDFSRTHLEENGEHVAALMLEAAQKRLGDWVAPISMTAHRWRYAKPSVTHPASFLAQDNLLFCGDWCTNTHSRIEAALESGWQTAQHVLEGWIVPEAREVSKVVI